MSVLRAAVSPIILRSKTILSQSKWRKRNPHNFTRAGNLFPHNRVKVGNASYGTLNLFFFGDSRERIEIGHYCSIAADVSILAGGGHSLSTFSSYPFTNKIIQKNYVEAKTRGPIFIEDDVWIGHGVTILSGVRIHQGAVIGSGSVVTKDVPPYGVFIGTNLHHFRFDNDTIQELLHFDFSLLTPELIRANQKDLRRPLDQHFFNSDLYRTCRR